MDEPQIQETISKINDYVAARQWFDFDVMEANPYSLKIGGGLDPSAEPDLVIEFTNVFFLCLPMAWRTDTTQPCLLLAHGEKARSLNLRYHIEQGNHVFLFRSEMYPHEDYCLVAAQAVSFTIRRH